MSRNQETVVLNAETYTQLTNADANAISFQTLAGVAEVRYTTDDTPPSPSLRGSRYTADSGELQETIANLVYLSSAVRVWAIQKGQTTATMWVDHEDAA